MNERKKISIVKMTTRPFRGALLFLFLLGCIEPYEFLVEDNNPGIVIEGIITDKSYNESLDFPSDGRQFTIKLSRTSDVINTRSEVISGASVVLVDDLSNETHYYETETAGTYAITDPDFKAEQERSYKLTILVDEVAISSEWVSMPDRNPTIGSISYNELTKPLYKYVSGEQTVVNTPGIDASISLAPNNSEEPVYYRFDIDPTWIYIAPLSSVNSAAHQCWVTNPLYLGDYVVQEDNAGGYALNLFFMETERNDRIFEDFSALISQKTINKDYYAFLHEMQERNQGGLLNDRPPYNLETNFTVDAGDVNVYGFFSVAHEQTTRWYFNKMDLSYNVENTLRADCSQPDSDPGPECFRCDAYPAGTGVTTKPTWWH